MTELSRPPDRRTLHFGPLGLGGAMPPELSRKLLDDEMARMELGEQIPEAVRSQFAKLKGMYLDGLFRYELFTAADRDSFRVLEATLKVRFLSHYSYEIPLIVDGNDDIVRVHQFEEVRRRLGQRRAVLKGHPRFNGSLSALLHWARAVGYFRGQRNRIREKATISLRNEVQHTEHDLLSMPPDALRSLGLLFEWIQRLWGYDTPGGDAYPGPIRRIPWVVGQGPNGVTWFELDGSPAAGDASREDYDAWHVVLAAEGAYLGNWRPGFECTGTPVEILWGPGAWTSLSAAAVENADSWESDAVVDILDRAFFVRVLPDGIELPRSAAQVRALRDRRRDERWAIIRADAPGPVMHHLTGYTPGPHRAHGPCASCAVEVVMSGSRRETIDRYARGQRDTSSSAVA